MSEMGGVEAGPLYVDVVADTTGFAADLKAKIAAEVGRVKATIKAEIDAKRAEAQLAEIARKQHKVELTAEIDDSRAQAELDAIAAKRRKITVQAEVDDARARTQLEALEAKRRVTEITVEVNTARAEAQIAAAAATQHRAELQLDVDTAKAEAEIELTAAKKRRAEIQVEVDEAKAQAQLDALEAKRRVVDIQVDADVAAAEAKLAAATLRKRRVQIQADADDAKAEAELDLTARDRVVKFLVDLDSSKLDKVGSSLTGIGTGALGLMKFPAIAAGITMAAEALVQVAGGLFSVASAAAPALGVLGAIPGLAAGAAQGIGAVVVGFMGIPAAVQASQKAEAEGAAASTAAAAQRKAAAERVANAQDAVKQAITSLANTEAQAAYEIQQAQERVKQAHVEGAQEIERAQRGVTSAVQQAAKDIAAAEAQVTQAQRDATQAQLDLISAREQATRQLQDMNNSLADQNMTVEQARIDLIKANQRKDATDQSATATDLDKEEADLQARQAAQRYKEEQLQQQRLTGDTAKANKAGVEGSALVQKARQRVQDTTQRLIQEEQQLRQIRIDSARKVTDAERALTDARVKAAKQIADAEAAMANTQRQTAYSVSNARHQVTVAQRELTDAQAAATTAAAKQTAAQTALSAALAKLSPAGRSFVTFLTGTLIPAWQKVQKATQEALLPPVQRALQAVMPLLSVLQVGLVQTAGIVGGAFENLATKVLATPLFKADLQTILANNNRAFGTLATALAPFVQAIVDLTVTSGPLLQRFASFVALSAQVVAGWIHTGRETGRLQHFFQLAGDTAGQLWRIIRDLAISIFNVGKAAYPAGRDLLKSFEGVVAHFRAWTGSLKGQNALRDFFKAAEPTVRAVGNLAIAVVQAIGRMSQNKQIAGLIDSLRTSVVPALESLGDSLTGTFGPALVQGITDVLNLLADIGKQGGGGGLTAFVTTLDSIVKGIDSLVKDPVLGQLVGFLLQIAGAFAAISLVVGPVLGFFGKIADVIGTVLGWVSGLAVELGLAEEGFSIVGVAIDALLGPVGLIIAAVVGIGIALYELYQHSTTFHNIVNAAFSAVGRAAQWLWKNAILPAFNGIIAAAKWVGQAAVWLWNNAVRPAFAAMGKLITWWWVNVTKPILTALVNFVRQVIFPAISWLYTNVFRPIFSAIAAVVRAWWALVQIEFKALIWFIQHVIAPVLGWLWRNVVVPAFKGIGAEIKLAVKIITGIINALNWFLRTVVGPTIAWLFNNVVKPYFTSMGSIISTIWNSVIKPAFNAVKTGLSRLADAFRSAVGLIGKLWGGLREAVTNPVKFVIDTIYNNGIRAIWNKVADVVSLPELPKVTIPGINGVSPAAHSAYSPAGGGPRSQRAFALGGVEPGYAPGQDTRWARVSPGEGFIVPEAVRGLARTMGTSAEHAIQAINATFSRRVPRTPGQRAVTGPAPAFDVGGVLGWVGHQIHRGASAAGGFVKGTLGDALGALENAARGMLSGPLHAAAGPLHSLINRVLPEQPRFVGLLRNLMNTGVDKAVDFITGQDQQAAGDGQGVSGSRVPDVGSGVERWRGLVMQVLSNLHLNTNLVDRVLRQITTESGGNPNAVQGNIGDVNNRSGDLAKGLIQVIGATFRAFHVPGTSWNPFDPLANLSAGLNYAAHTYGPSLSFLGQGHGYDSGGILKPGVTTAVNGTGQPEYVFTTPQWDLLRNVVTSATSSTVERYESSAGRDRPTVNIPVQASPGMDTLALARGIASELAWVLRPGAAL